MHQYSVFVVLYWLGTSHIGEVDMLGCVEFGLVILGLIAFFGVLSKVQA